MKTERDGKLRIALERLLWRYPLLGGLVATWDYRPMGSDTMAVGMNDQGFILYYCPDFVAETSIDQLVGVLHHEVRHILYGHVMMDPDEFADEEALLVAQETTVNEGLPEPLPEGAVRLEDFPELPPDEDTLTRYDRLRQESEMSLQSESDQAQQDNQEHEPDRTSQDEGDNQRGEIGEKSENESANTPQGDEGDSQQGESGKKPDSESGDAPQDENDSTPRGEGGKTTEGEPGKPSKDKDDGSQRGEGNNMPDGKSTDTSQGNDGGAPQGESGEKSDGESANAPQDEGDGAQQDTGGDNAEGESDKSSMDKGDEPQQDEGAEKADSKSIDDPEGDDTNTPPGKGGEKEVDESGRPSKNRSDGPQRCEGSQTPDSESARASQSEGDGPQQEEGGETPVNESEKTSKSKGASTPRSEGSETAKGRSGEPSQAQGGMPVSGKDWDDDHGHWQEIRDRGSHAKNLIDIAVQGFLAASEQRPSTEDAEMDAVDLACQAWGITPGKELTQLPDVQGEPTVDWRRVLRRRVGRLVTKRPTYARPPRRFPDLIGIVPGTAQSATKPTILAAIDTSGSMTDETLAAISRELEFLTRDHRVVVAECDCKIQAVYRYRPIVCVKGGGGTDFRPPLECVFLRKHTVDLVIYFTDGWGPAPENRPYVPVIWVLTPDGTPPAPWAKVLKMG